MYPCFHNAVSVAPLEEVELKELAQESGLAHAGALVNEGKFANALGAYSTIETPQAAFNAAQVCVSVRNVSVTFPPLSWPNYMTLHARYVDDRR